MVSLCRNCRTTDTYRFIGISMKYNITISEVIEDSTKDKYDRINYRDVFEQEIENLDIPKLVVFLNT